MKTWTPIDRTARGSERSTNSRTACPMELRTYRCAYRRSAGRAVSPVHAGGSISGKAFRCGLVVRCGLRVLPPDGCSYGDLITRKTRRAVSVWLSLCPPPGATPFLENVARIRRCAAVHDLDSVCPSHLDSGGNPVDPATNTPDRTSTLLGNGWNLSRSAWLSSRSSARCCRSSRQPRGCSGGLWSREPPGLPAVRLSPQSRSRRSCSSSALTV